MKLPIPKGKIDRAIWPWFAITVVLAIAVGALWIAYLSKSESASASREATKASQRALAITQCVNNVLALRQSPQIADSTINNELWDQIGQVLNAPPGSAEQEQVYGRFLTTLNKDLPALKANQAFRAANPLGAC